MTIILIYYTIFCISKCLRNLEFDCWEINVFYTIRKEVAMCYEDPYDVEYINDCEQYADDDWYWSGVRDISEDIPVSWLDPEDYRDSQSKPDYGDF